MKLSLLVTGLLLLASPALAQEETDRNAQMELLKQNFMQRQGIPNNAPHVSTESEKTRQENKEYRDAVLKAINDRKVQTQGMR